MVSGPFSMKSSCSAAMNASPSLLRDPLGLPAGFPLFPAGMECRAASELKVQRVPYRRWVRTGRILVRIFGTHCALSTRLRRGLFLLRGGAAALAVLHILRPMTEHAGSAISSPCASGWLLPSPRGARQLAGGHGAVFGFYGFSRACGFPCPLVRGGCLGWPLSAPWRFRRGLRGGRSLRRRLGLVARNTGAPLTQSPTWKMTRIGTSFVPSAKAIVSRALTRSSNVSSGPLGMAVHHETQNTAAISRAGAISHLAFLTQNMLICRDDAIASLIDPR